MDKTIKAALGIGAILLAVLLLFLVRSALVTILVGLLAFTGFCFINGWLREEFTHKSEHKSKGQSPETPGGKKI